ncbi:hypothetical protein E2C01_025693 [Portunus trituberculatus]|uniref:Uncharacterized protein n=1 Tax=Portunus trituberculatus TaxID=210409 RepID=A0A5B7EH54_PORTR|nr:hypothetical protein [Portunus trituberculatus]
MREKYWKLFLDKIAATRPIKEVWNEVNKVQRGVGLAGDSQKIADDLIDKWAHASSISSLHEAVITEQRDHEVLVVHEIFCRCIKDFNTCHVATLLVQAPVVSA